MPVRLRCRELGQIRERVAELRFRLSSWGSPTIPEFENRCIGSRLRRLSRPGCDDPPVKLSHKIVLEWPPAELRCSLMSHRLNEECRVSVIHLVAVSARERPCLGFGKERSGSMAESPVSVSGMACSVLD